MERVRMWVLAWVVGGCRVGAEHGCGAGGGRRRACGVSSTDEHPPHLHLSLPARLPACLSGPSPTGLETAHHGYHSTLFHSTVLPVRKD